VFLLSDFFQVSQIAPNRIQLPDRMIYVSTNKPGKKWKLYKCAMSRNTDDCKACTSTVRQRSDGMCMFAPTKADHVSPICYSNQGRPVPGYLEEAKGKTEDITTEQKLLVDKIALSTYPRHSKDMIWAEVHKLASPYHDKNEAVTALSEVQVKARVENIRQAFVKGSKKIEKVEVDHGCGDGGSRFLRHRASFADCENGVKKVQQMLIFSLMPLLMLLGDKMIQIYFDGTLCCAPDPFKQCLIVMIIYAAREHKYIPIMWILLTGKTSRCYNKAISWVSRCLPGGLCPDVAFGGTDFEPAFFGAVKIFFRDTLLVGCRFHLKQVVRRRLLKMAMHRILSMLDYAPMLPDHEIVKKGCRILSGWSRST